MLPEPGHIGGSPTAGDADELIARMADAQIDKMLGDADIASDPEPPVPNLITAPPAFADTADVEALPPRVDPIVDPLADVERSTEAASAVTAALDAAVAAAPPQAVSAFAQQPIGDLDEAAPADDVVAQALRSAPGEPVIAAQMPSSFGAAPVDDPADSQFDTSAAAVAAELAEDAQLHGRSTHLPPPAAADAASDTDVRVVSDGHASLPDDATPEPALAARVMEVPWIVLDAINAPVRGLSDPAREALGVVAILTIVNASGLLIYRLFIAPN